MSNLKGTTLIEKKSPIHRRNTVSSINNILKTSFADGFMSFIESKKVDVIRPNLKESEEMIESYFKRIDSIIVNIDQHIANRLEYHET
jgi:fructose-1-phosphate kinase PfkB-like protein